MAQKVNSLNLRLNKRINWNTKLCTHNFNDYSNNIINSTKILTISKIIMYNLKILQNTLQSIKTSKIYKINSKIVKQHFFFFLIKLFCCKKTTKDPNTQIFIKYQSSHLEIFKKILKKFLVNKFLLKHSINKMKKQKTLKKDKFNFLSLSLKIFTEFAKNQINSLNYINYTQTTFSKNLQKNFVNLLQIILNKYKYDISGIKIICFGKWKKTNSDRKQKIYLKFGQIQTSNLANKILYHGMTQRTKFGICSVKIWISHKKSQQQFWWN